MPRALITGATGFLGMSLSRLLLADGWEVTAVHRSTSSSPRLEGLRSWGVTTLPFVNYDELTEVAASSMADVAFHLASHQAKSPRAEDIEAFIGANISLGTYLLEGLAATKSVCVSALSYFQFRNNVPTTHSLYSATKQAFTEISAYYRDLRGVDIRDVVLFDNFGPGDTRKKLIPDLIDAIKSDRPILLGPASQPINALHVDDVAAGLLAASRPGNPNTTAVRAYRDATVGEIVGCVERVAQRRLRSSIDPSRTPSDLTTIAGVWPAPIGWTPTWTLADGIAATYRAYAD